MIKLPAGVEQKNLINDLRKFCWEAADTLLYYAQILKDSKNKSNIIENDDINDPVTIADLKVNEIIIKRIKEKYSNVQWEIISEENAKIAQYSFDTKIDWMWILDPLDGTKDFIQGTSNYATHLALNYKQKPYIGVVLIPEKDELWIAAENDVWCEKRDGFKIKYKSFEKKALKEMVLVTSKNHGNDTLKTLIQKIRFKKVINMGSIGCKIASIIRGEADIYICLSLPGKSTPKDWDFAAPEAVLNAIGGKITYLNNEELKYCRSNFEQGGIIIASNNSKNHKNLCLEIKEIIKRFEIYPINY